MKNRFVLAPVLLGALALVRPAVHGALSPTTPPGAAQSQAAVAPAAAPGAGLDPVVLRRAEALVRQYVVIDAHTHDPGKPASPVFPRQVTLPLMVEQKLGGLVQVVPFSPLPSDHPVDTILADLRRVKADLEADARVGLVLTSEGFVRNRGFGRPSVMLGVEYFQGLLDGRVETLDTYYKEGVRVVGLSHAAKDLVTEGEGETRILTAFGRKVVETMNALGIVCDVTHLPDVVRRQVIAASRAPILVSHSAARSLVPSPFNVDDETLDRLAASNGLIGVTFCSEQLSKETFAEKGHVQDPTKLPPARVQDVVDQIDYLRKRVGIHRVALGTDFGGSGRMAPAGLGTSEGLPLLAYHMLERGYSEPEIGQVLGRNFVDFVGRVERASTRPPDSDPIDREPTVGSNGITSGYLDVTGGKIYYEVAGAGDWIVLVHDGNLHSVTWDDQFPVYAKDYRVVRYDRRGYGKSSYPDRPYSNLEDLEEVFRQLNIDKATVMGMSAGGALSIDFTLAHPEKVTRLVLVGAVVSGHGFSEHGRTRGGRLTAETLSDPAKLADYMCHRDPYTFWEGNPEARRRGYAYLMSSLQNYQRDKSRFLRGPARTALPNLGEIKVPTLIVVGEYDLPDCHAVAGILEVGIAGSIRTVLPKSAHIAPLEQPAAFNELTLAFLKGKSSAPAGR